MSQGTLWVSATPEMAFFRLVGRGSFQNAGLLKQAATEVWGEGCRRVILDLADCRAMDSTFLGVLAGLALRSRQDRGQVILSRISARNRELVQKMGLDRILTVSDTDHPGPAVESRPVEGAAASKDEAVQTMIEAHRHLVAVDPGNEERFQDVIDFLKDSARRRAGAS